MVGPELSGDNGASNRDNEHELNQLGHAGLENIVASA